jgi:RNA polymerase sigma-70 factor, ECF subfamily
MAEISQEFEELYKVHYKMLRNAANNIIGDHDASHDIVQEVFIKLFQRKDGLQDIQNLKAYLFRSVVNASITYLENNKNRMQYADLRVMASGGSDSKVMLKELEAKIQAAMNRLPPKCKAVFVLSRFDEMKNKEIADLLGLSLKTVENQMGIALKRMREELKPYLSKDIISLVLCAGFSLLLIF